MLMKIKIMIVIVLKIFWGYCSIRQSSKDSTSPMSETCKIRTGQVKFQDHKPDWACKIVESKLKKYWTKQTRIPFLKPLSQLAHDHFTALCDRNILASHDLSHTLHDHSHSLHLF